MRIFLLLLTAVFLPFAVGAQKRITPAEYIEKYKHLVVADMHDYGIPASVKMAQAMLESDCGNSRLAIEANNHFGIKCKSNWRGQTLDHDDDSPGECFRKYSTPEDSFRDHAEFISKSARYERLFALDRMDYKAWAKGLKDCGYATSPVYPDRLIKMIETHKLYELDSAEPLSTSANNSADTYVETPVATRAAVSSAEILADPPYTPVEREQITIMKNDPYPQPIENRRVDPDNYAISTRAAGGRPVYHNNGTEFLIARKGDTFEAIAASTGISTKKLRNYNDAPGALQPGEGEFVYLREKAWKALNGKVMHTAVKGETLRDISQHYGIRLNWLTRLNRLDPKTPIATGQQIRLM